jgi:hypothetical protein
MTEIIQDGTKIMFQKIDETEVEVLMAFAMKSAVFSDMTP